MNFARIALLLLLPLGAGCQYAEPETYLIPYNFNGEVHIFFSQDGKRRSFNDMDGKEATYTAKLGQPVKYENGRRVYEVPSSGILLTQFSSNPGFINKEYYSVDPAGSRTRLEVFKFEHFKKDSAGYVVVDPMKRGIFGDGTTGSLGNENVKFQSFIVSDFMHLSLYGGDHHIDTLIKKFTRILGLLG